MSTRAIPIPKGATIGAPEAIPIPKGATIGDAGDMTPQDMLAAANRQFARQGLPAAAAPSNSARVKPRQASAARIGYEAIDKPILGAVGNVLKGVNQSGWETAKNLGDFVLGDKTRPAFDRFVSQQEGATAPDPGVAGKVGFGVGQVAQFMLPGEAEASSGARLAEMAPRGLKFVSKTIPKVIDAAAISKFQGGSPLLGAITAGAGEGVAQGLNKVAPSIAESALGIRRAERAYGKTPGRALLRDTKGIRPATVARSAQGKIGALTSDIEDMAREASVPTITRTGEPQRLALPPGKFGTEIPASPEPPDPAFVPAEGVTVLRPADLTRLDVDPNAPPQRLLPLGPVNPPVQLPLTEGETVFLPDNGQRPEGYNRQRSYKGQIMLPQEVPEGGPFPLNQRLGALGMRLDQSTVSLQPALNEIDQRMAVARDQNDPVALNTLGRVRERLTQEVGTGTPIPIDVTPKRALDLKRGVGKIGNYHSEPEFDRSVGSKAGKAAARAIDQTLDEALGPEFASKNQRISSLIDVKNRAASRGRSDDIWQRFFNRVGAHTGALAGAATGGILGYQKNGWGGFAQGAALGAILPEMIAAPTGKIAAARLMNAAPRLNRLVLPAVLAGDVKLTKK